MDSYTKLSCENLLPVLEHMPGYAFLQKQDYTIPYANSLFRKRFGNYEEKRCYQIFHKAEEPCKACMTAGIFESMASLERELKATDGRIYRIYDTPLRNGGAVPMLLRIGVDITERTLSEEEARKARNLESLFVFARGIAHDFNNILTAILGNISLGKMISDPKDKIYGILSAAERSSTQARDLINQFLMFSRMEKPCMKKCRVRKLLDAAAAENLMPGVFCSFSVPADLWPVEVDESQMIFAFSNLFGNACSAMIRGGVIHVAAENVRILDNSPLHLKPGDYVKIVFRDQGKGIPQEFISRVFDPYVTTKAMGQEKGVGLGLTMCYSIMKNHGGYITAESDQGSGTAFTVFIPALGSEHAPGQ